MRIIYGIFFIIIQFTLAGQNPRLDFLITRHPRQKVEKYQVDSKRHFFLIESKFSSASVQSEKLNDIRVTGVDYVYTANQNNDQFDQTQLDRLRFKNFVDAYPAIMDMDWIPWNLIEQKAFQNHDRKALFHGFVLYYEPPPDKYAVSREIDSIEKAMSYLGTVPSENTYASTDVKYHHPGVMKVRNRKVLCAFPKIKTNMEKLSDKYKDMVKGHDKLKGNYDFKISVDAKGIIQDITFENLHYRYKEDLIKFLKANLNFVPATFAGKKFGGEVEANLKFPLSRKSFTLKGFKFPPFIQDDYMFLNLQLKDYYCQACHFDTTYTSTIPSDTKAFSEVFNRNRQWKFDLLVTDVTSSMYPYTVDMLQWIRLNTLTGPKEFVFFNDGDCKKTEEKKIGETGGIYRVQTGSFNTVKQTILKAMRNGNGGGDAPENNFEALLTGQKECTDCEDIIMVADNYAFPRDASLLQNFRGHLKIILCGTENGINTEYLNIARKYNFSIHTSKSDVPRLSTISEGKTIVIDQIKYQFKGGAFSRDYRK